MISHVMEIYHVALFLLGWHWTASNRDTRNSRSAQGTATRAREACERAAPVERGAASRARVLSESNGAKIP